MNHQVLAEIVEEAQLTYHAPETEQVAEAYKNRRGNTLNFQVEKISGEALELCELIGETTVSVFGWDENIEAIAEDNDWTIQLMQGNVCGPRRMLTKN